MSPLDVTCPGYDISMVKPSAWLAQHARKTKQTGWVNKRVGDAAENLSFVDFMKSLPIFHSVGVSDISEMEAKCPSEAYRDGESVLQEGSMSDTVYIIREGGVRSVKAGSNAIHLTRGDYFGECALTDHPSPSSYFAVGNVLLICVPAKTFEFVLSTADSGDWASRAQSGELSNVEVALSRHIDQFLDILALFQTSAEAAVSKSAPDSCYEFVDNCLFGICLNNLLFREKKRAPSGTRGTITTSSQGPRRLFWDKM